jgi:hypothetical protein
MVSINMSRHVWLVLVVHSITAILRLHCMLMCLRMLGRCLRLGDLARIRRNLLVMGWLYLGLIAVCWYFERQFEYIKRAEKNLRMPLARCMLPAY